MQKSGKVKMQKQKQLVERVRVTRDEKQARAAEKHQLLKGDARERVGYLREKDNQRS